MTSARARGAAGRVLALASCLAVVGGLAVVGAVPGAAADGTVSGTVFRDFNADGVLDPDPLDPAAPRDRGMAGVTVMAYDADDDVVGTAVSAADGTYSVPVADARTAQVRLQFTDLPEGLFPSFSALGAGAGESGSNVQLADLGDTDVDFGVSATDDYQVAGLNTPVATSAQYAGQRQYQVSDSNPEQGVSLAAWPWQDQWTTAAAADDFNFVNDGTAPDPYFGLPRGRTTLAHFDETGGLWGTTARQSTGDIFAAAALRRQVDFGPGGIAAIYRVPDVYDPVTGVLNATPGPIETWLDMTTLADFGTFDTDYDARGGMIRPQDPIPDSDAYTGIGTIGIGSIAVSGDQSALYVMNLNLREIEVVDIATKTLRGSIPLGLTADDRPWALATLHGQLFVGYIENATATDIDDVKAVVRAAPEADIATLGTDATEVLRIDLDYQRGTAYGDLTNTCSSAQGAHTCVWHPWTNEFDPAAMGIASPTDDTISWPQPILTDLAFASDGQLVIGFADRFGIQIGYNNIAPFTPVPVPAGSPVYEAISAGETLIAAPDGDGYTLEDDGVVGGLSSASTLTDQGPGGREFFNDSNVFATDPTRRNEHQEITTGGLATLPGSDQILSTGFDTISEFRTNGFAWFNTRDGASAGTAQRGRMVAMPIEGALSKAGGLGDVTAMLVEAPLQIGNVVWFDADQDGVQDADEPPVPGVTVRLVQAGDTLATTTTDENGQYYFDTPSIDGFDPRGGDYTVQFELPTTGDLFTDDDRFGTVPWSAAAFTTTNAGDDDTVDSDAVPQSPTLGNVAYAAGGPGENDPNLDAGLIAFVDLTVTKALGPDSLPVDPAQTFTIDVEARDFRGDPVDLGPDATLELAPGGSASITDLPVGTQAQVTEPDDPNYDVTIDPEGYFVVDGDAAVVTVTNTRVPSTGFQITKELDDPSDVVPPGTTFTGTWTCSLDGAVVGSGTWTLTGGGTVTVATDVPVGSSCTVTETIPPTVPGGEWEEAVIGDVVLTGEGGETVPVVTVTNTFDADATGFSITKTVSDEGDLVPDGTTYSGTWVCTLDGDVVGRGTWTLTAGQTVTVATDLPVGAECAVLESTPPTVDGGSWEPPTISGTITLGVEISDPVPVVGVSNTFTPTPEPTPTPTPSPSPSPTGSVTPTPGPTGSPTATPAPSPTPPGGLSSTGADVGGVLPAIAVLLGLGVLLVIVARRRA